MYDRMRRDAEANWSRWAREIADGGPMPPPLELLEAGALLGLTRPAEALEADARAIVEVRGLEAEAAGLRERSRAQRAPHGDQEQRRARIAELERELRTLRALAGIHPLDVRAGELLGRAGRIRREFPRGFRPVEAAPKPKTPRRRKEPVA